MQYKNLNEIDELSIDELHAFAKAFCAEFDPTSREQRICLGDLLTSAHWRFEGLAAREMSHIMDMIASALVNS